MRRTFALAVGAAVAAMLTYSFVYAGSNLDQLQPVHTYAGLFQHLILRIEAAWSTAHGWEPLSRIDDFGRWFADAVRFGSPALGYLAFCLVADERLGRQWKPWAVVATATVVAKFVLGYVERFWLGGVETAWTLTVLGLMLWSAGALLGLRQAAQGSAGNA